MTQSIEAKVLNYAGPAAMIKVFGKRISIVAVFCFLNILYCDLKPQKNSEGFEMKKILSELKQRRDDLKLMKRIEHGIKNREFKMHLQFIVDNKTKKIVSAEALSRWERADGEIVPPVKYIGAMERSGIISKLDYYMFEKACRKLSEWKETEFDNLTLSCNFTRITISEKDFAEKIIEIAEKYVFDRRKLLIEITEDSMEKNLEIAMKNIKQVKERGFRIALDDIGRGYTSLSNLCEYPIDVVKMDRDILLLTDKERGKKLFSGIISLAHYLNLSVVCEGVETEEQNLLVSESACDYIQGWYYCKAMPENTANEFALAYMQTYFKGEPA